MSDEQDGVGTPPPEQNNPLGGVSAADILPEEFKGRDPAEIKVLLSQMPRIVKAQKEELENLRLQMAGGTGATVTHGAPSAPQPTKTEEEVKAEFEELFDKDPRAAIKKFVMDEFAPVVSGLENRVNGAEFKLVRQQIPDFDDFEDDVKQLLSESRAPATEQNIRAAYEMAVGKRVIQMREIKRREALSSPPADPAPNPEDKAPELSDLQAEVAGAMGLSAEEFQKYSDPNSFDLKIRT